MQYLSDNDIVVLRGKMEVDDAVALGSTSHRYKQILYLPQVTRGVPLGWRVALWVSKDRLVRASQMGYVWHDEDITEACIAGPGSRL